MVQLRFVIGRQAGLIQEVRRFPCVIGRGVSAAVRVEEPGVWDKHLQIILDLSHGFMLRTFPNASVCVNGQPTEHALLKNGDWIEMGSSKIQFWLNPPHQKSQWVREILTWSALIILSLGQVGLVYWLSR